MEEVKPDVEEEEINYDRGDGTAVASGAGSNEDRNPTSSGSDSDSDSDQEDAKELQIETLERQLEGNPLNYEVHVQYIQLLRKLCHIEKLRQARESMSCYFPLSPKMWQEWTKDEVLLNADSERFKEIEKLYERGVCEYLCVPLWCDYIDFVQERDPLVSQCAPAGLMKMRNLFERALTGAGLHVSEGSKIWEAYREYEQAILLTVDENDCKEKEKQAQRIRALFHRQLSVPLLNLKSTLVDYKLWEASQGNLNDVNSEFDGVPTNVVSAYQKALEMCNARASYEEQLSSSVASDLDKLQYFMNYIKLEESYGDPVRVQIVYERAVTEFPVSSDLWLGYTKYLDRTLKVSDFVKGVYSRATRNCPWVGEIWINRMLSLERMSASEEELSTVFELAIQSSFAGFTERAVDYLSPQVISIDDILRLHAYWARLEATIGKDIVAARGVWENLIKKSGSLLEVWQGYIAMEIRMGHINEARSIYKRCYSKRFQGTGSEDICHSWLQFEREYGSLDDLDLAAKKVTPRLQELKVFKMQQDSKASSLSTQKDNLGAPILSQKRKANKTFCDSKPPAKKRKDGAPKPSHESPTVPTSSSGVMENVEACDKQETTLQGTGGHGSNAKEAGDSKLNKSELFYSDKCTAFISNLSLEANEQHLHQVFKDSGGVTAIRLLRDKFTGKSRGLAYVDFSDEEHLAAGLTKSKQKLLGRKLSIARSNPKQGRKKSSDNIVSQGYGRGHLKKDPRNLGQPSSSLPREERGNERPARKVTFAAPRALVKPLGWSRREESRIDEAAEKPKSNEEFREMLIKK
ncbi:hypothetical protein HPP92_001202 [Vanilla planifolia]|uniref:RRM domain-containing protein n=1 Tax=Vanilla planifolia TaxID=51239 RepID=A0A835VHC2_VANPL|nr:hypothetical protein HPP92_001202 [Vanilla planifolia]